MLKFETVLIKIPNTIIRPFLLSGLLFSLWACQPIRGEFHSQPGDAPIIGGKPANNSVSLSKKVIYLALGVRWQVTEFSSSVTTKGVCTASALSPTVLITAAHCVVGLKPNDVNAVLSNHPFNHSLNRDEWISVRKIIIHPEFSDTSKMVNGTFKNDIALIQLESEIPAEHVSKIARSQKSALAVSMVAIGYGQRSALANQPESNSKDSNSTLLYYIMKKIDEYELSEPKFEIIQHDRTGVCKGDSGGPGLVYNGEAKEFQILGILSHISISETEIEDLDPEGKYNSCIGRGHYSNILFYLEWITRQMSRL